jgi:hypothetical protein
MRTTLAALLAVILTVAAAGAAATNSSNSVSTDVSSSVNIIGGGSTSVLQDTVGTSSAEFSTVARGVSAGGVDATATRNRDSATVTSEAFARGNARSATEGTVTGNAAGVNFSQVDITSSEYEAEASADYRRNGHRFGDVDVTSTALGSASAGSRVELGPNAPGATTAGTSTQASNFFAVNRSVASAGSNVNERGSVINEASLYLRSAGRTNTGATGVVTGVGGTGFSTAVAGQGGTADGDITSRSSLSDIEMNADGVGTNFTLDGSPVASFSIADNGDGATTSGANSRSIGRINSNASVTDEGRVVARTADRKLTEGEVVVGDGQAGGGVTVDFNTEVDVDLNN